MAERVFRDDIYGESHHCSLHIQYSLLKGPFAQPLAQQINLALNHRFQALHGLLGEIRVQSHAAHSVEVMVFCAERCIWGIEALKHEAVFVPALRATGVQGIVEVWVGDVQLGG